MSEPIFRAFNNKTKEWIDEFYIDQEGNIFIVECGDNCYLDAVLCRSTGLRDSKRTKEFPDGEMIFENDIVKFYYHGDKKDSNLSIGMIRYSKRRGAFMIKIDDNISSILLCENIPTSMCITDPDTNIERIGNVLENTELLEQKQ